MNLSKSMKKGDARRLRNNRPFALMKCPQRKLLATDDDMLHPQAEERHRMAMLKKSIDESETRNEKRLEQKRQQNMREHAIE